MVKSSAVIRKGLCKFASPVLGRSTPRFLNQIEHWLKHKGSEWVVERMKATQQAAEQLKGGDPESAKKTLEEAHISFRKDKPVPHGPFGQMANAFIEAQRGITLKRASALLRSYTGIFLTKVSANQLQKARINITSPSKLKEEGLLLTLRLVDTSLGEIRHEVTPYEKKVRKRFQNLDASAESGLSRFYCGKYRLDSETKRLPYASAALSSLVCGDVPKAALKILGDLELRREACDFQAAENLPGYGKITFLQEGGCKARVVCQPSFWNQVYFRPCANLLFDRIRFMEANQSESRGVSCVLDQNRGAYLLKTWIGEKRTMFSFDLSAATDRFPIEPQLRYLQSSGMGDWADAFKQAKEGKYLVPSTGEFWKYSVGQPMGLCGSFPLFHLTHYAVLDAIAKHAKVTKPAFAVLGDDVLIGDANLAKAYTGVMQSLGVELSPGKTLIGSVQAFAGFKGIATSKGVVVFRPFKHGSDFAIHGKEVNLLSTMGSEVRKWSSWWSKQLDTYLPTIPLRAPDLSPLLPTDEDHKGVFDAAGSRWLGSLRNRIQYILPLGPRSKEAWNRERDILFSKQGPDELRPFNVESYVAQEKERRKNFTQISQDSLMKLQRFREEISKSQTGQSVSPSKSLGR